MCIVIVFFEKNKCLKTRAGICSMIMQSLNIANVLLNGKIVHNLILLCVCCAAHNREREHFCCAMAVNQFHLF
jgi:hypothetical protein